MNKIEENIEENHGKVLVLDSKELTNNIGNVRKGIRKFWTKEYIHECLHKINNPRDKMLIQFLYMSGIRESECLHITKSDVDFQNSTLTIKHLKRQRKKKNINNQQQLYRLVPLHNDIRNLLYLYSANLKQNDLLFAHSDGRPFTRHNIIRIVKKYGLGSPHRLRHSFAYHWLQNKKQLPQLKEMLGHSNINTTMQYLKICPEDLAKDLNDIKF